MDDDYDRIAEILQNHEWQYQPGHHPVGFCIGQEQGHPCKWTGTQFEWAWHVEKLIYAWIVEQQR